MRDIIDKEDDLPSHPPFGEHNDGDGDDNCPKRPRALETKNKLGLPL